MKARSRHWRKIPGVNVPKGVREFQETEHRNIFHIWWLVDASECRHHGMMCVLIKGCTVLLGSLSSQAVLFLSSLYLPHLYSRSLSGPELSAEPYLPTPSLRATRLPSSLHLYTLIIGHHLPDLSLTSLFFTQQAHQHSPLTLSWHLGSQACHSCHLSLSYTFVLFGHPLCPVIPLSWVPLTWTSCV